MICGQVKMLRALNNQTACCIQRCAGMDAMNATYIVTYEIDKAKGTNYHERFKKYVEYIQDYNLVVLGAMTDPKGERNKQPNQQADPDLFLHVVEEREDGIVVRGAKAHFTGVSGAHSMLVFPTQNLKEDCADYAVVFSCPVNTPGITYIFGRQTNDNRKQDPEHPIDQGNYKYATVGGECLAVFNDVFIPWEDVYLYKDARVRRHVRRSVRFCPQTELRRLQGRYRRCPDRSCLRTVPGQRCSKGRSCQRQDRGHDQHDRDLVCRFHRLLL